MIKKIHIENFKSIYDLTIKVDRINVFIGENGSGKSNFLESLVFASASDSNKLDNEFLISRGLRVTKNIFMRSAFEEKEATSNIRIELTFNDDNEAKVYELTNDNDTYTSWKNIHYMSSEEVKKELESNKEELNNVQGWLKSLKKKIKVEPEPELELEAEVEPELKLELKELTKAVNSITDKIDKDKFYTEQMAKEKINKFVIYSPENTALRNFYKEGQIEPLGINGEGLLKLITVLNNYDDKSYINTIQESLELFSWFDSIEIPKDLSNNEDKIVIKDKFLYDSFDQRSANEGFLFILFYITLVVSKETPKAFAIDNIDASLNPKLCTKLITILTELAKKYDKQIFLTTHNPAILDGINLNDEEQKLFVISRNKKGYTRIKNITSKDNPISSDGETLHLSEAFLRGYLGGLPKGF